MKLKLPIALLLVSVSSFASNQKEDPDLLYQQAVIPYEQGQPSGLDLMLKAADAGSIKALCVIASAYQGTSLVASYEAREYYKRAAELGGLCGMMELANIGPTPLLNSDATEYSGNDDWTEKAKTLALKKANEGDFEAIKFQAYIVGIDDFNGYCDWMEKAAELGDADAMKQLAGHIEGGCGWYLIPGSRDKAVKYWLEQAANHGNPRAMTSLAMEKFEDGQFDDMIALFKKAADMGDMNAREMLAGYMVGMDMLDKGLPPEKRDKLLAYTLLYPFFKQLPQTLYAVERSKEVMDKLDKELTEEQKAMARKEAEDWMKTHQVRDYSLVFH